MSSDAQIAREWASKALSNDLLDKVPIAGYRAAARHILATTTPPTMADMTEDEREACQWMQATSDPDSGYTDGTVVIVQVQDDRAVLMWGDGSFDTRYHQHITPLPDLPRMAWPASEPESAPDHPEFLETEEDYENAPEGTIVAEGDDGRPSVLVDGLWRRIYPRVGDHGDMSGIRRRVLRWGWEA